MIVKKRRRMPISIRMRPEYIEAIDALANDAESSRTYVIETAIEYFLEAVRQANAVDRKPKKKL